MGNVQIVTNVKTVPLEGRVAAMICFLKEYADQINRADKIKITFDCAGRQVRPSLTYSDALKTINFK